MLGTKENVLYQGSQLLSLPPTAGSQELKASTPRPPKITCRLINRPRMKTKCSVRKYRSLEAHQQRRITNSHATPSVPLVSRHPFANDRQAAPTKAPTGNSSLVTQERKSKKSDDRHLPNPGLHSRPRSIGGKPDLSSPFNSSNANRFSLSRI